MKIGIYADNTLALPLSPLCDALNRVCVSTRFAPGQAAVRITTPEINHPKTYRSLLPSLQEDLKTYDLGVISTTIPYDNNFFFEGYDNSVIISFSGWNLLTDLPITNGLVYFVASMLADDLGVSHDTNTGCINDFWWDKRGVDLGMRAAFLCRSCRQEAKGKEELVTDIDAMLNLVASASRTSSDVLSLSPPTAIAGDEVFDVFLCHNDDDKPRIRKINSELREAGLRTWFDEEQIKPGMLWQMELEKQIKSVRAACVFVGENGFGPWQDGEVRSFLSQFFKRSSPVIPVLLPSASTIPELPIFLQEMMWVDLRKNYAHGLARLIGALRQTAAR